MNKDFLDSSTWEYLNALSQKIKNSISMFAAIANEWIVSPAAEEYRNNANRIVTNIASAFQEVVAVLSVFVTIDKFGDAEYVMWKGLPKIFIDEISATSTTQGLLELVWSWLADSDFTEVRETIDNLKKNEYLMEHPVFLQSLNAYDQGNYSLAALGFTAMTDKLLSIYSGKISVVNIEKRVNAIVEKIEEHGQNSLSNEEFNDIILFQTYTETMKIFGESRPFEGDEPIGLNRHWIMHGRMTRSFEQIDCIRLINILYGTILMSELAGEEND